MYFWWQYHKMIVIIQCNWNHLSAYVMWNILVLNIKGKINKIAIKIFITFFCIVFFFHEHLCSPSAFDGVVMFNLLFFGVVLFFFVLCLVYQMCPVSLDFGFLYRLLLYMFSIHVKRNGGRAIVFSLLLCFVDSCAIPCVIDVTWFNYSLLTSKFLRARVAQWFR